MDDTTETLIEIKSGVKALHTRFDDFKKTQEKHAHTLYGNGQPGLTSRVHTMEQRLKFWAGVAGVVVTAIILAYFGIR